MIASVSAKLALIFFPTLLLIETAGADSESASTSLVDQGPCGRRILKPKGITDFDPVVKFDEKRVSVSPRQPQIPGCFNLTARNVAISRNLDTIVSQFELRFGPYPSGTNRAQKCRRREDESCPCGIQDSCMYCDFCKKLNSADEGLDLRNWENKQGAVPDDTCKCDIRTGSYDFNVQICTPDAKEIKKTLPESILSTLDRRSDVSYSWFDLYFLGDPLFQFNLYVTLLLYDTRFNFLNPHLSQSQKSLELQEQQRKHLIGCHVMAINVNVRKT